MLEVATDEIGHISYNRMRMGPSELAQARLILPVTARVMATAFPEIIALGGFPIDVLPELPRIADPRRLPEAIRREAFIA